MSSQSSQRWGVEGGKEGVGEGYCLEMNGQHWLR